MMDPDRGMQHKREATRDSLEVIMQRRLNSPSLSPPKATEVPEAPVRL